MLNNFDYCNNFDKKSFKKPFFFVVLASKIIAKIIANFGKFSLTFDVQA